MESKFLITYSQYGRRFWRIDELSGNKNNLQIKSMGYSYLTSSRNFDKWWDNCRGNYRFVPANEAVLMDEFEDLI